MLVTHKTFLYWLIYITAVVFAAIGATMFGLPQLTLAYDHSHLTVVLVLIYFLAEALSGIQVVSISRESRMVAETLAWLDEFVIVKMRLFNDRVELIGEPGVSETRSHVLVIPNSPFADHLRALWYRTDKYGESSINQRVLIDTLSDRLWDKVATTEFFASRIVWLGILATIVGVIMAFWPFMAAGMTVEMIRANLAGFFGGIAVAFIPTAVSFVFKIALDVNTFILSRGVHETVDRATIASEAHVVPYLERFRLDQGMIDLERANRAGYDSTVEMAHFARIAADLDAQNVNPQAITPYIKGA